MWGKVYNTKREGHWDFIIKMVMAVEGNMLNDIEMVIGKNFMRMEN